MTYGHAPAGQPVLHQPYSGAPFPEAIVRFVKKTFVYRGRASRSEAPGQYSAPSRYPSAPQSDPHSAPDAWNGPSSTDPGQTR